MAVTKKETGGQSTMQKKLAKMTPAQQKAFADAFNGGIGSGKPPVRRNETSKPAKKGK